LEAVDDVIYGIASSIMIIDPLINDIGVGIFIQSANSESGAVTLLDLDDDGYMDAIEFQSWPHITQRAYLDYTIRDQNGGTKSAVIFVAFQAPTNNNEPPIFRTSRTDPTVTNAYNFTYYIDTSVGFVYATDANGDNITYSFQNSGQPFTVKPNGEVIATRRFVQADIGSTFNIVVDALDGNGGAAVARVRVTIANPVRAVNDEFTLRYALGQVTITSPYSVLGNDTSPYDRVSVELIQQAQHGLVTLSNDGFFTYRRTHTFEPDSFSYQLRDRSSGILSNVATVRLAFQGTIILPSNVQARDDHYYIEIDPNAASYSLNEVLANDTIPNGATRTVARLSRPRFGEFQFAVDGTRGTYTPDNANFHAMTETFQYTLTVGDEVSIATIYVHFREPEGNGTGDPRLRQGPPQFVRPYYVFRYNGNQTIGDVSATDPDNDALVFSLNSAPAWITGVQTNGTTFRISVANNQQPAVGSHTFTAVVTDNNLAASFHWQEDFATIVVLVDPVGQVQAPVFTHPVYNVTLTLAELQNATTPWIAVNQFVRANDPQNQVIEYSVPSSTSSFVNPILVNRSTGQILVNVGAILEPNSNRATVIAQDTDGYTDVAEIHIAINGLTGYRLFVKGNNDSHNVAGNDIAQGALGNCWFQSVLAAIADQSPQVIEAMIHNLDNNVFEVRFFQRREGQLAPVWVPVQFNPQGAAGVAIGADIDSAGMAEIWPRIIEMAYIQFVGGAGNVEGGAAATAWEMITGFSANPTRPVSELTWVRLTQALDAGQLVWVGTKPGPVLVGGLAPTHIYRLVSYVPGTNPPATGIVTLDNPQGINNASLSFTDLLLAVQHWWIE
jgi:hypothetical protein